MNLLANQVSKSILRAPVSRKIIGPVNGQVFLRLISTSDKGGPKQGGGGDDRHLPASDPTEMNRPDIIVGPGIGKAPKGPRTVEDFKNWKANKNWISSGFDYVDQKTDEWWTRYTFATWISFFFCGVAFILMYYPDHKLESWAEREAYLELARRKKLGMKPYISRDYVDPARITLPTEEELEGFEIIV